MKNERAQRGVAAGTATANGQALAIHFAVLGQVARGVDAVRGVDDAPAAVEPLTIGPTVATAAAIVDVDHAEAAASPVLDVEVELRLGHGRRSAMALDD